MNRNPLRIKKTIESIVNKSIGLFSIGLILLVLAMPMVMAASETGKTIIVRNDDVGAWWSTNNAIYVVDIMRDMGIPQTIGIVPLTSGGTIELSEDPTLVNYLVKIKDDSNVEFGIHGYDHGYNEFESLTQTQAEERIRKAKSMVDTTLGIKSSTFIPPYYAYNEAALYAAKKQGVKYFSAGPNAISLGHAFKEYPPGLWNVPATTDFVKDWNLVNLYTADEIKKSCQNAIDAYGSCVIVVHHHVFTDASNNIDPAKISILRNVMEWVKKKESEGVRLTTIGKYGAVPSGSPKISTQPVDKTVAEGQTATFTVVATGTAPLAYQWQKNGVDISGAKGASYTTPPATLADCGSKYRVVVKNSLGRVISESATLTVVDSRNRVLNPGFESGTDTWVFYTDGKGSFTADSQSYGGAKAAKLVLKTTGKNIQLYQPGIKLEANTRYRLSFVAYSTSGHDLTVRVIKHGSPYTAYAPDFKVNLGTKWQSFATEFTTKGFTEHVKDGRLMFWLAPFAAAGDTYYIDDVRLEKV